jgi:ribA/ribD-fused uncharacterized protein
LFRGTLKDERRDLQRVLENKTRIFTAGSMEKVIADRMLFLDFVIQFKAARIEMQHAYGVNPEGLEWNDMISKHLAIGSYHFGFDYSGFDASESLMLLQSVSECVASCYPAEFRKHVVCSGIESFNHFVVIDGDIYHYPQGNPSGCTMTTIYNTIANWLLLYYAWIKLAAENSFPVTRDFFVSNCVIHAYGDDFICTVSDAAKWFNGETIPPILSVCGITATAPDKSECVKFIPLDKLTFLTRSFIPNNFEGPRALFVGPLPKELIEEIPMWMFTGASDDDYKSTLRTCLRSAAFWGRQYFNWYVSKLRSTDCGLHFLASIDVDAIFRDASKPFTSGCESFVKREKIFFNSRRPHKFLSNFHRCKVMYKGMEFHSVENAYQFAKVIFHDDCKLAPDVFFSCAPGQAQAKGKGVKTSAAWEKAKPKIMYELLQSKFSDRSLAEKLKETGDATLVEWTPNPYWAAGLPMGAEPLVQLNYPGQNRLGLLLMDVRRNLNF